MKKRILSVFVVCLTFSFVGAQDKIYVSLSGNDSNNGSESAPLATVEAAAALVKENTPTVIHLQENATFNISRIDFLNNKNVEVIGNNTTLKGAVKPGSEGGEAARILRAGTGCDVKLKGLNFMNGRQIEYLLGGAVFFSGNTMEVENCKFINNESGSAGAGIGSRGKKLTVKNCYFEGNYTIGGGARGAAIMHCGPNTGVTSDDNTLTVINSTFYKNRMPAGGQGVAIGIYDPSTNGGAFQSSIGKVEITNCTFVDNNENATGYQGSIDINNSDASAYLVNNTFYNEVGAFRTGFTLGEIVLINNVVYAQKAALFSDTDGASRTMKAYNNVFIGGEAAVNEFMTDACLHADKVTYNNIVEIASAYPLDRLGLATVLSTDRTVPYLPIIAASSVLINAGLDDSTVALGSNIIPVTDNNGYETRDRKDIGAFEYDGIAPVGIEAIQNTEELFGMINTNESVIVMNNSTKTLKLQLVGIDGSVLESANVANEYVISKNGPYKGIYVLVVSDGEHAQSRKIVF